MEFWIIIFVLSITAILAATVGYRYRNGGIMLAAGSWALLFVVCGILTGVAAPLMLLGFPLMGSFGITFVALGLKSIFRYNDGHRGRDT